MQVVTSNNFEGLLIMLDSLTDSATAEHDDYECDKTQLIKDDSRNWNVFHFAAHHQSDFVIEKLVRC